MRVHRCDAAHTVKRSDGSANAISTICRDQRSKAFAIQFSGASHGTTSRQVGSVIGLTSGSLSFQRYVLDAFSKVGYRPSMHDADKLKPADPSDLAAALFFALRYQGRKSGEPPCASGVVRRPDEGARHLKRPKIKSCGRAKEFCRRKEEIMTAAPLFPAVDATTDGWARARLAATLIPDDVSLDDVAAVVRALLAARLCVTDFVDVLSEATEIARRARH
jgi:hypothetical protein